MRPGRLDLVWEIPLSVLSWAFYQLTRLALGGLVVLHTRSNRDESVEWHLLSAEEIAMPLRLPVLMTSGPRWNPHALIARLGPFRAAHSIVVDADSAARSATAWTVVVYQFPTSRTVASVGQRDARSADGWLATPVEPGSYTLALRYYGWQPEVQLPAVRADGVDLAQIRHVSADVNERLYADLPRRRSRLYVLLHYHVYTMLRLRRWLPRAFVERQLLPIGNPETRFEYGHLPAAHTLELRLSERLLAECDVYLTRYGRDSFPIDWVRLASLEHHSQPLDEDSFYLIRINTRGSTNAALIGEDHLSVVVR